MKNLKLALAVFMLVAFSVPASAASFDVFSLTGCEGCAGKNVSLNFEGSGSGDVPSLTAYAFALQLNAQNGRYEGPGVLDAKMPNGDVIARDPLAQFSVEFGESNGCPIIVSLFASGSAIGSGEHFALSASQAPWGEDPCLHTKLSGVLEIGQGKGLIKKSWGSLKVGGR